MTTQDDVPPLDICGLPYPHDPARYCTRRSGHRPRHLHQTARSEQWVVKPRGVLYLVACAAPPAADLATPIRGAQELGWDVCVIVTPSVHRWATEDPDSGIDLDALAELTGYPVRHTYKLPSEPDLLPSPDALLVAPMTNNTVNKWAAGVSDTLALGLITEAIGLDRPIIALPHFNRAQAAHPAVNASVATLRGAGVNVLLGEGGFVPHEPRTSDRHAYPWLAALAALPTLPAERD
ncbi:flavoprotein [Kitasatospora sp. NPDC004723]|uniref:flavoprotein n=1 Tax=Kitasatospora sp. NPDC004723 TaxID=3154288 RepID=UPI0033A49FE1